MAPGRLGPGLGVPDSPVLLLHTGMVDDAGLVAIWVPHDDEVCAVRVRPVVHACRAEPGQALDMAALLAGAQVQVHPDRLPGRGIGQLKRDREPLPARIHQFMNSGFQSRSSGT